MEGPWFHSFKWKENPFMIQPDPEHIVGFVDVRAKILTYVHSHDPFMIIGPTGSGKTTLLKWVAKQHVMPSIYHNFLEDKSDEKLRKKIEGGALEKFFGIRQKILLLDEAQEMSEETAKWLKELFDSRRIASLVLAGINEEMKDPPLRDRVGNRIVKIRNLTEREAFDIIKQRIFAHGKHNPLDDGALYRIFRVSSYSPRKILENCEAVCIRAADDGIEYINEDYAARVLKAEPAVTTTLRERIEQYKKELTGPVAAPEPPSDLFTKLSPMQVDIIKLLAKHDMTTDDIAAKMKIQRGSVAKQLSRLSLSTDADLLKNRGVSAPLVEPKSQSRPVVYGLTADCRTLLERV